MLLMSTMVCALEKIAMNKRQIQRTDGGSLPQGVVMSSIGVINQTKKGGGALFALIEELNSH